MLKKMVCLLWLFSAVAQAEIKSHEHYYSFLQDFNIHNYQQCNKFIQACPRDAFPDADCVEKIFRTKKVCQQFAKLNDLLTAPLITVKRIANFFLITENFPADGQNNYSILSNGYLINTNIDPRELDANLEKKYKKTAFFIVNWDEPNYQKNRDGSQSFFAKLKISDGCLACSSIAFAKIEFEFDQLGNFIGAQLKSFQLISDPKKLI